MAKRKLPQSVLEYVDHLRRTYKDFQKAYIFGSYAKGCDNIDSDIDIAVIFDQAFDSFDLQVNLMKIRRQYDTRIEPHVFPHADFDRSNPLVEEIIDSGVELQ